MKGLKYHKRQNSLSEDLIKLNSDKEDAFKLVILISTTLSGICILCLCLTVPTILTNVISMKNLTGLDLRYCHNATEDISSEIGETVFFIKAKFNRTIRDESGGGAGVAGFQSSGYGGAASGASNNLFQECPACCKPGPQGPPGDPGVPGLPGSVGSDGSTGRAGSTPNASCLPERVFEPPPCLPCPQGSRGVPGHPGFPGEPGDGGISGRPGYDGPQGDPGAPGPTGNDGQPGAYGPIGDKGPTPEGKLVPGPPGDSGDPGPWGPAGHPGQLGDDGPPGLYGEKGYPGPAGPPGDTGPLGPPGPGGEAGPPGMQGTCACQDTEVIKQDYQGSIPAVETGYNPQPQQPAYGAVSQGGYSQPQAGGGGGGGFASNFNAFNFDDGQQFQSVDNFQQIRRDLPQSKNVKQQNVSSYEKSVLPVVMVTKGVPLATNAVPMATNAVPMATNAVPIATNAISVAMVINITNTTTPMVPLFVHESESGITPKDVVVLPDSQIDDNTDNGQAEIIKNENPILAPTAEPVVNNYPLDFNNFNTFTSDNNYNPLINSNQSSYYKYGRN